jgi:hypothetical protein
MNAKILRWPSGQGVKVAAHHEIKANVASLQHLEGREGSTRALLRKEIPEGS